MIVGSSQQNKAWGQQSSAISNTFHQYSNQPVQPAEEKSLFPKATENQSTNTD